MESSLNVGKKGGKGAKKGVKPTQQATVTVDIIPELFPWLEWEDLLYQQEDLLFCIYLAQELVDSALKACLSLYVHKQKYPYAAGLVGEALKFFTMMFFPMRDTGEGDLDHNPSFIADTELESLPHDLWDRGVLPKAGYMNRPSSVDDEIVRRLDPNTIRKDAACSCINLSSYIHPEYDVNGPPLNMSEVSSDTESRSPSLIKIFSRRGRAGDTSDPSSEEPSEDFESIPEVTGILHPTDSSLEALLKKKRTIPASTKVVKDRNRVRKTITPSPPVNPKRSSRGPPAPKTVKPESPKQVKPDTVEMLKVERLNEETREEYGLPSKDIQHQFKNIPTTCSVFRLKTQLIVDPDNLPNRRANVKYEVITGEEVTKAPEVSTPGIKKDTEMIKITTGAKWIMMKQTKYPKRFA